MAMMEHLCDNEECNYVEFNNSAQRPNVCPKCGSEMSHFWDDDLDDVCEEVEHHKHQKRFDEE
jgi:transcription initiation factor IIE alpha subunit